MATQVNGRKSHNFGGLNLTTFNITLITSGTTVTLTLPVGTKVRHTYAYNVTTETVISGGTYVRSTGVWVSGTAAVNDVIDVTFLTETAI
jgi:hypothetical protein